MRVSLFVCVRPQAINHSCEMKLEKLLPIQQVPTAFRFLYVTLAINITDECDLSNKVCREFQDNAIIIAYIRYTTVYMFKQKG